MKRLLLALSLVLVSGLACGESLLDWTPDEVRAIASHDPWPPAPPRDPGNRVSGNGAAAALGRQLFEELRRSSSRQVTCGDRRQAGRDWRDGRARGFGMVELDRHTPPEGTGFVERLKGQCLRVVLAM